jgi:hypothetical protein
VAFIFRVEEEVKQETSVKRKALLLLRAGFLLRSFFGPEDGSDMFLRNVD